MSTKYELIEFVDLKGNYGLTRKLCNFRGQIIFHPKKGKLIYHVNGRPEKIPTANYQVMFKWTLSKLLFTGLLARGTVPMFSDSSRDAGKQFILHSAASTVMYSLGLREELSSGLGWLGDIRGALNFLFASRDAKPLGVKENKITHLVHKNNLNYEWWSMQLGENVIKHLVLDNAINLSTIILVFILSSTTNQKGADSFLALKTIIVNFHGCMKTTKMTFNLSKYDSRTDQQFMCKGKWKFV